MFYIQTDLNAPCGRIIAIDIRQPQREHWREIIPEQAHALAQVTMAGGRLILVYMRDVQHEVRVYRLDGTSILAIYEQLAAVSSLEPDAYVTALFTRLVTLRINERNATGVEIMRDPAIQATQPHLHQLCAIGEYCLERSWSTRIAHSASPEHELMRFPYYRNYQQLTLLERHAGAALSACAFKRTLFVGAGPLPLTPLLLAHHCEVQIDTIDVSDEASLLGQHLIEQLGMTDRVRWYHTDILDFTRLEP